jgi:hypothetical protein
MLKISIVWPPALLALSAACGGLPGEESAATSDDPDVGQVEEALLLPAQNAPFGYQRGDGVPAVVSLGSDNHIHEMPWVGSSWAGPFDFNALFSPAPPNGTGSPSAYVVGDPGGIFTSAVVYRSGGSIIQFFAAAGQNWNWANLRTLAGGATVPLAESDPAGMLRGGGGTGNSNGIQSVVYRSTSDDIIELNTCGNAWNARNLTTLTGAPKALNAPKPYTRNGGIPTVVYRSDAKDIIELIYYNGGWTDGNLSAITGAPDAADEPMGYARREWNIDAVVYRATNNHIIELSLVRGSNWSDGDLTAISGAPNAEGRPWAYVRHDGVNAVVFRGSNDHIWELTLGNSWAASDLFPVSGATVNAASSPRAFKRSATSSAVVYRGTDNRIYELRLTSSGWSVSEAS